MVLKMPDGTNVTVIEKMVLATIGAIVLIAAAIVLGHGCESPADVTEDIKALRVERDNLQAKTEMAERNLAARMAEVRGTSEVYKILKDEVELLEAKKDGRKVTFFIELDLRQSHFTLDWEKHAKDAMNALQFSLPVDEDFYNEVKAGQPLVDKFRSGSAWVEGSFGSWKVTVNKKYTRISER